MGTVLDLASGVARVPMHDVIKGVMPFMLAELAVLFLLVQWSWSNCLFEAGGYSF